MNKDRRNLVAATFGILAGDRRNLVTTAFYILAVIFASVFFPTFRNTILIVGIGGILLLATAVFVLLYAFIQALSGPKSLSGTRCLKCGKWRAMQEVSRQFLQGDVKFSYDHYRVVYRCAECVHEQKQVEHFARKR